MNKLLNFFFNIYFYDENHKSNINMLYILIFIKVK